MPTPQELEERIAQGIPGAKVVAEDLNGNGDHFQVAVQATAFADKSRVEQHQMIYAALGDAMREEIHALAIQTSTQAEHERSQ